MKKNIFQYLLFITLIVPLNSCLDQYEYIGSGNPDPELGVDALTFFENYQYPYDDIGSTKANFTLFREAISIAGMDNIFSGPGPFTIFAMNDEAFNGLMKAYKKTKVSDFTPEQLQKIIKYGMLSQEIISTDLKTTNVSYDSMLSGYKLDLRNDTDLKIYVFEKVAYTCNLKATNGVIHVIRTYIIGANKL